MRSVIVETKRLKMVTAKREDLPLLYEKIFSDAVIMATAHPENIASKRVLEKVGMELIEESKELGNRGLRDIYALLKREFA